MMCRNKIWQWKACKLTEGLRNSKKKITFKPRLLGRSEGQKKIGSKAEKKLLKIISHSHRKKKKLEGNAEVMLEQISHALTYSCFHLFYAWEVVRTDNYKGHCLNTKQRANPSSTSSKKGRKHASSQLHACIGQVHIQNNLYNIPKLPAHIFVAREQANSRIIFAGRLKITWRALPPRPGFHATLYLPTKPWVSSCTNEDFPELLKSSRFFSCIRADANKTGKY